ncbi:DUF1642 domain-containing protein [Enterococcus durans]|uniref:DUF1642 domain-containing protein n=1 Tax=Enterococcus durans TaxID=53345 RepID=UPI0014314165|nr:DUF1642 domain-containing protein [Enterococcus durans]NJE65244.1 DUF1642 domain-containing protein [Enterococcus durans]
MKTIEDIIRELNLKCTALNTNSVTIEQTDGNNEFKCNSHVSDFNKGKIEGLIEAKKLLEEVKQLDEPQRETIPKCAHEFILEGTGLGLSYFEIITSAESFANAKPQDEFSKWLRKNSGLFIRSLLNGYEVEKEPEYHVILSKNTGGWKYTFLDEEGSIDRTNNKAHIPTFTEKKVKAIDERYWAFAVPVEEVEEG